MNKSKNQKSFFLKIWPIYALISGLLFALYQGWDQYLTPSSLGLYAVDLNTLVENNFWVAFTGFVVIYILSTVFMIPASALTIMGGFLFGTIIGVPTTVISATAGACILFMLTKYSFNDALQNTAGPFLKKMEKGFKENSLSYLFSLRLIPLFPFAVVNIAPALLGARFSHYLISTLFGIIPGTLAYTLIGTGLRDTLLDASSNAQSLDVSLLIQNAGKNFVPAFFALSLLALMPVVYKYLKKIN